MIVDGYGQETGSIRGRVKNATTGKYLSNAQVVVDETGQTAYTNEYGEYRLQNVPVGSHTVTAKFVGLSDGSVMVDVGTGVSSGADISLRSSRFESLSDEEVFELEAFEVDGSTHNSDAIALNEQRNSANLISVQHAEAFGEIAEGNIGEYLKNLPGVSVNYVAADVRAIKMRGMSPAFTQVTVDGSQMASAGSGNKIRSFELEQVSLANVEMLEVSKLPRPDMSANAIGGSVNLVSKNAFAQGRQFSYKLSMNFNDEEASLNPTPGWEADTKRTKVLPGVELNYSDVFMDDRLGVAMTYKQSNMYNVQQRFRWREWELEPEGGNGGPEDVYFKRLEIQDGPKKTTRESFSSNIDFKVNDDTTFSFKGQVNSYDATWFNRNVGWRINDLDADETPDSVSGSTDDVSDNSYTFGEERGISYGGSFRNKYGNTYHLDAGMKHYVNDWEIDYGYSHSEATNHYADSARGMMETWEAGGRGDEAFIEFNQGNGDMVAFSDIKVYDEDMNLLPDRGLTLSNFELRRTRERPKESVDRISGLRVNARRNFTWGENQGYFQFGVRTSRQEREGYQLELRYDYEGYNKDGERIWFDTIRDDKFSGHSPGFGYEGFDWPSIYKIHDLWSTNRTRWELDGNRAVNNTIGTWFEMQEDIDAAYAMGQLEMLDGKLSVLAGARYEDTSVWGLVPEVSSNNYVNSATDFFFETSERTSNYDNIHPSVHIKYDINKNLLLRISYANTIGRPDFGDMFGPTVIETPELDNGLDPDDPDYELTDANARGTIEVTNPGLLPRESDNFDITAEYYYSDTGLFSVSVFKNDMTNFIKTVTRDATQADLEFYKLPQFVLGNTPVTQADIDRWNLHPNTLGTTFVHELEATTNVADATIEGLEVNWKQDLDFDGLPAWLQGSSIYANGTFLSTNAEGDASPYQNDFQDFAKKTVNYGYLFDYGPLDFKLRWNIRGDEIGGSQRGYMLNGVEGDAALFREERKSLDFDLGYRINDRATLFLNARNLNDAPHRQGYYLPDSSGERQFILEREERFGTQWTVGVKGQF
ncbi:TonB-dependent receptor [Pelagicoccus sp. SDUM812003]|uniref:TonB-dependent receptor n=1 Tax=Pelagicoccus sp. SDUM812003 TaxID=3041267 RepID=UPI00280FBD9C|nr:TonB-dependent receptor [Pelagicoccus sp. SDUM812003]MDQ8205373.1 TonB-dependent receptor [Pelagicoccus sp. SDUM812003]